MKHTNTIKSSTGRAQAVFVFGRGEQAKTVISTVTASVGQSSIDERLFFAGSGRFDDSVKEHIHGVILSIIDTICRELSVPVKNYELSISNPGGASIHDLGIEVSGFSADLPVFLGMLSAALNMPVPDNIVATGHIASTGGDISAVGSLGSKLSAAIEDKSIDTFIYPDLKTDCSIAQLSPSQKQRAEAAIIEAKGMIELIAVHNICELLAAVFSNEATVTASLENGFYESPCSIVSGNPVSDSINYFVRDNESRFWSVLEDKLLAGDGDHAKKLLRLRIEYQVNQQRYAHQFGAKLLQLIRSLPPVTRKLKVEFPLISTLDCVRLSRFAGENDATDIRSLYDAAEGKNIPVEVSVRQKAVYGKDIDSSGQFAVDTVVSQISSKGLAERIGIPIDTARSTYVLDSLRVVSDEQFFDTIAAFYLHLKRHISGSSQLTDDVTVRADAIELVERTFVDMGKLKGAMNEAIDPIHGGMRFILDLMTEQFRKERQKAYINRVIKEALSPLDVHAQLSFISALIQRLSHDLPDEIVSSPPERFIEHYEDIVREYVKSFDRINEVFRKY